MGYLCLYINNTRIVLPKHFRNIVQVCSVFLLLMFIAAEQACSLPPAGGPPGLEGIAGEDGLSCWDLNGDGVADPNEDINTDGVFDALDCKGPQGDVGTDGQDGPTYTGIAPINVDNTNNEIGLNPATINRNVLVWDMPGDNWVQASGDKRQPYLGVNYIIALMGVFPSRNQSDPFIGEIIMFAGNFAPRGWAFCDGQLLPISQNSALFSILGTTYGGDGRTTFGLPDLRGRVPIGPRTGPGLTAYRLGEKGGSEDH